MISPLLLFFPSILLWGFMVCVTVMAIDGLTQFFGLRKSTNMVRLATGLGSGAFFSSIIFSLAIHLVRQFIGAD
jgi:uncharacterized membrane protein